MEVAPPTATNKARASPLRRLDDATGERAVDLTATTKTPDRTVETKAPASFIFQMLSSGDEDDDDDDGNEDDNDNDDDEEDDDAATIMGSPIPAAQTLESSPPLSPEAAAGAWMQRRPLAPRRPTRIEDLFTATAKATVTRATEEVAEESKEEEEEEEEQQCESHHESEPRPAELLLSPASQLHILSQISEMAESRAAQERRATAAAVATRSSQKPVTRQPHAWAPIAQRAQTQANEDSHSKVSRKRKPPTMNASAGKKARSSSLGVVLLADVATWDAFEECILEGDDVDEDAWSFEEISDSDF